MFQPSTPPPVLPSKEEVLLTIERVDNEISKTEMQIHNLKKPKKAEHKHAKHGNLIQEIYEENKEKIQQSHEELAGLTPSSLQNASFPLYKLPTDLPLYAQNIQINIKIRDKVKLQLKDRMIQLKQKEQKLDERYKKYYEVWKKKVSKMESKRQKEEERRRAMMASRDQRQNLLQAKRPLLRSNVRATPRGTNSNKFSNQCRTSRHRANGSRIGKCDESIARRRVP